MYATADFTSNINQVRANPPAMSILLSRNIVQASLHLPPYPARILRSSEVSVVVDPYSHILKIPTEQIQHIVALGKIRDE